jgi:GntR family transcriptional regulator/MocR family aminotransferase
VDLSILKSLKGSKITGHVLSAALVEAIDSGILQADEKLPSTRDIADYLGLSKTTVLKVYKFLASTGYICSSPGAGSWVTAIAAGKMLDAKTLSKSGYPWESRFSKQATNLQSLKLTALEDLDFDEVNFGATPPDLLPLRQWRKAYLRVCDCLDEKTFVVNKKGFGYRPLREAIAGFLRRSKGIVCDPEQVILEATIH